eukprot:COSAG04_NODE_2627_length_3835_cov_7.778105_3_plen_351_part_00
MTVADREALLKFHRDRAAAIEELEAQEWRHSHVQENKKRAMQREGVAALGRGVRLMMTDAHPSTAAASEPAGVGGTGAGAAAGAGAGAGAGTGAAAAAGAAAGAGRVVVVVHQPALLRAAVGRGQAVILSALQREEQDDGEALEPVLHTTDDTTITPLPLRPQPNSDSNETREDGDGFGGAVCTVAGLLHGAPAEQLPAAASESPAQAVPQSPAERTISLPSMPTVSTADSVTSSVADTIAMSSMTSANASPAAAAAAPAAAGGGARAGGGRGAASRVGAGAGRAAGGRVRCSAYVQELGFTLPPPRTAAGNAGARLSANADEARRDWSSLLCWRCSRVRSPLILCPALA